LGFLLLQFDGNDLLAFSLLHFLQALTLDCVRSKSSWRLRSARTADGIESPTLNFGQDLELDLRIAGRAS
jgi:hypothetical protein